MKTLCRVPFHVADFIHSSAIEIVSTRRAWGIIPAGLVIGLIWVDCGTHAAGQDQWNSIGPQPINIVPDRVTDPTRVFARWSGRVAALAVDPRNASHFLLGAAQGGIWETFDAGTTWNPRTDDQASMATGAIAFAPSQPSLVYAGTGESNFRGDAYAGAGLLESPDGGKTWQMLNDVFAGTSFSRIVVDPANANNVAVSTVRGGVGVGEESSGHGSVPNTPATGVYWSSDGGNHFQQVLTGQATALVVNPNDFSQQYAALGEIYGDAANGVYRALAGGGFQLVNGPWTIFPPSQMGRIVMAMSPTDPNNMYVGISTSRTRYIADLWGIWVTHNAWSDNATWTELPKPAYDADGTTTPRFWYYFDLLVDPADSSTVYLAEYELWQYVGASVTWNQLTGTDTSGFNVHLDNHVMAWVPDGNGTYQMLLGNDGGAYISQPGNYTQWSDLNSTLCITEFYKGAISITSQGVLALGGAQDNLTSLYQGNLAWENVDGGDGGDCAISTVNPLTEWATSYAPSTDTYEPNNVYDGENDPGIDVTIGGYVHWAATPSANSPPGITDALPFSEQFFVHFEKSPNNDNLFIAGTASLWRCDNFFSFPLGFPLSQYHPSWYQNSPMMLDNAGNPVPISAMAFAPWDTTGQVYAFGTEDGQLRITYDGGTTWNNLDPEGVLPSRYVSGIAFTPGPNHWIYVAFSGLNASTPGHPGHLFLNIGLSGWGDSSPSDATGKPIDSPANCLAIDPKNQDTIYVGTDSGVWKTTDGARSWTHDGPAQGMPNVPVYDLRFAGNGQLAAFTHGRGAFLLAQQQQPEVVYVAYPHFLLTVKIPFVTLSIPLPNCPSCPISGPYVNPGDVVTLPVPLQDILLTSTVDLTATLLPSPDIQPVSGTQDYGVLVGQGSSVTRDFEFIAGPTNGSACGQTVQAVFQLSDQGTDLGTVSIPLILGVPSYPLAEDFHEVQVPALAAGWSSTNAGNDSAWLSTTNQPPNLPQAGEDDVQILTATNPCVFVSDTHGVGQSILTSPPFEVATSQAQLYFRTAFLLPDSLDGGVLEISIGGSPFQEFVQAGGSFVQYGYNSKLSPTNSLGPVAAWSGNSGGWLPVMANMPTNAAGQMVQVGWHLASSKGGTNAGWNIAAVSVTEAVCLPPVGVPMISNPAINENHFNFTISTMTNRTYVIENTSDPANGPWRILESLPGTGNPQVISVALTNAQAFYRFYVQFAVGPTVTTLPASGVGPSNDTLNGLISPNGFNCAAYFLYGTTTNYGQQTSSVFIAGTNTTPVSVENLLGGLLPGTIYHYALVASNSLGIFNGGDLTFTTTGSSTYIGHNLSVANGGVDGLPPLVILGEYSPTAPLGASSVTLPAGSVYDVKFYGGNYNFTLYALAYTRPGPHINEQTFQVVASQSFSNSAATLGVHTLPVSGFVVNAGDLLAFAGTGPYYPQTANDALNSDATYENSSPLGSFKATPPGGPGTSVVVGPNPDSGAKYEYIPDNFHNQGRTYAIGVDIRPTFR